MKKISNFLGLLNQNGTAGTVIVFFEDSTELPVPNISASAFTALMLLLGRGNIFYDTQRKVFRENGYGAESFTELNLAV